MIVYYDLMFVLNCLRILYHLDIDECEPDPCVAGNTHNCTDGINNYTCNCIAGWEGERCEIGTDRIFINFIMQYYCKR